MSSILNRSKGILLASAGVGLVIGGGAVLMHRRFKSRLRLIAEKVELMEDQICDLKDLVSEIIKEEGKNAENKTQMCSNNINNIPLISARKKNYKDSSKQSSEGKFAGSASSNDEDDEEFVEAVESYYEGIASGDDYEVASEGGCDDDGVRSAGYDKDLIRSDSDNKSCDEGGDDDDDDGMLRRVDRMFEKGDVGRRQAYQLLSTCHTRDEDVEYLWRLSKATYYLAKQISSSSPLASSPPSSSSPSSSSSPAASPKDLLYEAFRLASLAVEIEDKCADAHKWYAITLGSTNDYEGVNARIQNGYIFKEHIEKAIVLKPTDPSNHHLLGRWSYGVYMLSWMERKVAATLFSTPPSSTIQQSLKHFLMAEELNPGKWKENELFISKCYLEMGDYKEARDWLKKCQQLPCLTNEDHKNQQEIESLLTKYSYYLKRY